MAYLVNNDVIRVSLETAVKLELLGFKPDDMEDWRHHFYLRCWRLRDDVYERFGSLTDDGYYELTKEGGGKLQYTDVYEYTWKIEEDTTYLMNQTIFLCPTIYEVETWIRKKHKLLITVYSQSQESWMYRITTPGQKLEDGIYGEDYAEYEDALKGAIEVCLTKLYEESYGKTTEE